MMELYNNVADPSGVTRGRNPYNAKVVRSFIERGNRRHRNSRRRVSDRETQIAISPTDTSMSRFYFFNITGLEVNESVLEAELHLYRKRASLKAAHPSTVASAYYVVIIRRTSFSYSLPAPVNEHSFCFLF